MPIDTKRSYLPDGSWARAPWLLFWVALVVRLLYVTIAHTYRIPHGDSFNLGWEAARIGRALATGYGYADPFATEFLPHTGPTAWLPPVYPLIVGAVFKLFGPYTMFANWVLLAINCVFSASVARATWEIGARCCGLRVARWAGWIWALYPAAMQYATRWVWEMSLTTALFAWVLVLALRMRGVTPEGPTDPEVPPARQAMRWAVFGLAWGLIALSNSTLAIFLPVCGLWLLAGEWKRGNALPRMTAHVLLAAVVFVACIAPWTLRNWRVFHIWIPLRGNLGAEMYMGDGPGSTGFLKTYEHPHSSPVQMRLYAQMGEVKYVAMRGALAKEYIHEHRGHFAWIVLKRVYFFWSGVPSDEKWAAELVRLGNFEIGSMAGLAGLALALRKRVPAAGLFAWAFLLLPIPYYLVTVHARFRHPLEPLICVFGVYLFQNAERRRPSRMA